MTDPGIAHVSLNVSDLGRAVDFYRTLFGVEPAKHYKDYAKFELREPPLVLSLEPMYHRASDSFNHMGLRLHDAVSVKAAEARLKERGMLAESEDDVECCYSRQTKFWLLDPDRNMWEVYALTGEIPHRGSLTSSDALAARDRVGVVKSWEHKLGDPIPRPIDAQDRSIEQVRLRGTFNQPVGEAVRRGFLEEIRRVLLPGGEVLIHGLAADAALPNGFPCLPGPAALVRHAPIIEEPLRWLREAGFIGLYTQKLGERHNFEHDGVRMREIMVVGFAPFASRAIEPASPHEVTVVYKGPFARVVDDTGREYHAGERVKVDAAAAERLQHGLFAEQFVFLTT